MSLPLVVGGREPERKSERGRETKRGRNRERVCRERQREREGGRERHKLLKLMHSKFLLLAVVNDQASGRIKIRTKRSQHYYLILLTSDCWRERDRDEEVTKKFCIHNYDKKLSNTDFITGP